MKRLLVVVALLGMGMFGATSRGDYGVVDSGVWPKSWPAELEPLRKQARTLMGPMVDNQHFAIVFTDREQFEAAWPHLLKVKSKGTAINLKRGENFFLGRHVAGVVVHCPPEGDANAQPGHAEGDSAKNYQGLRLRANIIELVVDGSIVDLNRIPLPADTLIVDDRFKEKQPPVQPITDKPK
jgi:hypothetical protein